MTEQTVIPEPATLPAAKRIVSSLKEAGYEAFFVGGCVRDLLLETEPEDFDIVTSARPEEVQSLFPKTIPIGLAFGIVLVVEAGHSFEVATYRHEEGYKDGRRPSSVTFTSAKEDVRRRDFTINGLLMDPDTGDVHDFVDGVPDIKSHLIRTIGNPHERFAEDHLRMLRAVRFAANLDFTIDSETFTAIRNQAPLIERISAERIRDELNRLLTRGGARRGMELMRKSGLLQVVLPEVAALKDVLQPPRFHPEGDVWEHTLRMLDLLPGNFGREGDLRLAWAALLHDIGKPATRFTDERGVHFYGHVQKSEEIAEIMLRRFRFANADMESILTLIRHHMLFMTVTNMRPNRLKRFLRMPEFDLHLELHRLDCLASHGLLDHYTFCRDQLAVLQPEELHPPRLLSGEDLQVMGFKPGPVFKEILAAVETAQLEGQLKTVEEARRMVCKRWIPG